MFEENQPPVHPMPSRRNSQSAGKIIAIVMAAIGVVLILGGTSYFIGVTTAPATPTPTPSRLAFLSQTPVPQSPTPTPTRALSGTPGKSTVTPSPTPLPKSFILTAVKELDGFRSSNSGGNANLDIRAGRNTNLVTRGFIAFDISKLPQGAKITEAKLRLYQGKIVGEPYSAGETLKIDHLTYGDTLDDSDYGMAALISSFATLSADKKIEWKEIDTTKEVKDDVANARSMSQFRLHFSKELRGGTTEGDFAYFESGENILSTGYTPQLIVKYY